MLKSCKRRSVARCWRCTTSPPSTVVMSLRPRQWRARAFDCGSHASLTMRISTGDAPYRVDNHCYAALVWPMSTRSSPSGLLARFFAGLVRKLASDAEQHIHRVWLVRNHGKLARLAASVSR